MIAVDVSQAFKLLASDVLSITRYAPGGYNSHGRWVPSATPPTVIEILASLQPLSTEDLKDLPENRRFTKSKKIYTQTIELKAGSVETATQPDEIEIDGETFEIIKVENHTDASPPWYSGIAVLKGQG